MEAQGVVSQAPLTLGTPHQASTRTSNGAVDKGGADALPESALNDVETVDHSKFVSSKGINFKVKPVSNWMIVEATRKIKAPKVPKVFIAENDREEENLNDPDYIEAIQDANVERGKIAVVAQLGFGTEVILPLPDGLQHWTDTEWEQDLKESLSIDVPQGGKARYAAWLRLWALDTEDITALMQQVSRLSGDVPEPEVAEAVDSFRDTSERGADTTVTATPSV